MSLRFRNSLSSSGLIAAAGILNIDAPDVSSLEIGETDLNVTTVLLLGRIRMSEISPYALREASRGHFLSDMCCSPRMRRNDDNSSPPINEIAAMRATIDLPMSPEWGSDSQMTSAGIARRHTAPKILHGNAILMIRSVTFLVVNV
jgi:hypothetical protein